MFRKIVPLFIILSFLGCSSEAAETNQSVKTADETALKELIDGLSKEPTKEEKEAIKRFREGDPDKPLQIKEPKYKGFNSIGEQWHEQKSSTEP